MTYEITKSDGTTLVVTYTNGSCGTRTESFPDDSSCTGGSGGGGGGGY